MSGYDWEPDRYEDRERERAWEQADRDEHAEQVARDRLDRDVGERAAVRPTMHEAEAMRENCAACQGDPESHGRHVCGREDFA